MSCHIVATPNLPAWVLRGAHDKKRQLATMFVHNYRPATLVSNYLFSLVFGVPTPSHLHTLIEMRKLARV